MSTKAARLLRLIQYRRSSKSGCQLTRYLHTSDAANRRHVGLFHRRASAKLLVCRRCQEHFLTSEALDDHLRVSLDQMCATREAQGPDNTARHGPEDGITTEIAIKLADRKSRTQVLDWSTLWKVLFPEDDRTLPEGELNFSTKFWRLTSSRI